MAGRTKPQSLEQRMNLLLARHQIWIDPPSAGEIYIHCSWCEEKLLIDYFQFPDMTRMLINWTKQHALCEPTLKAKPKDMMLTPRGS